MSKYLLKSLEKITKLVMSSKALQNKSFTQPNAKLSALSDITNKTTNPISQFLHSNILAKDQQITMPFYEAGANKAQQKRRIWQSLSSYAEEEERSLGIQRHEYTPRPRRKSEWEVHYEQSESVLQIRYQGNIFLMCTVDESEYRDLQRKLGPTLKRFGAKCVNEMHLFKNAGLIDAIITPDKKVDYNKIKSIVSEDADYAGARSWSFINYGRGIINFKCDPMQIADVCSRIESKGYRIMSTEYGFAPKKTVSLNTFERASYLRFLKILLRVPGVVEITDNVQHPSEDLVDINEKRIENKKHNELLCS